VGHPTITFSNQLPQDLVLSVDAGQMGRVMLNLLKNAREALESAAANIAEPTVSVTTVTTNTGIILSVTDNGPGLPPKARENLFVAFQGSARAGGTGLGLAIAREIAEAHGGQLLFEDQAIGTRFDIVLPLTLKI
jgi:signal transduction histidine kinase